MVFGAVNNQLLPLSCLKDHDSSQCIQEASQFLFHTGDRKKLDKIRHDYHQESEDWLQEVLRKIASLQSITSLTDVEYTQLTQIHTLKYNALAAKHSLAHQQGNCGEHSSVALLEILEHVMRTGKTIRKIQEVFVMDSKSQNRIIDHQFLLLNNDQDDIDIKNDKKAVKKYLNSIQRGKICDSWNKHYHNFADDQSGFYKNGIDYDHLEVKTISLDFSGISQMRKAVRNVICAELATINKELAKKSGCQPKI